MPRLNFAVIKQQCRNWQTSFDKWISTSTGKIVRIGVGYTIWIAMSILAVNSVTPEITTPYALVLIGTAIFAIFLIPEVVVVISKIIRFIKNRLKISDFRPGDLVCLRQKHDTEIQTILFSVEPEYAFWLNDAINSGLDFHHEYYYETLAYYLANKYRFVLGVTHTNDFKQPKMDSLFLVLEEEKFATTNNILSSKWNPYANNSSKIKVLFEGKVYWANPEHFKVIKKAQKR